MDTQEHGVRLVERWDAQFKPFWRLTVGGRGRTDEIILKKRGETARLRQTSYP